MVGGKAQNSDDVPITTIATIRELYRRLHQPANMMIVAVGNVDFDRAERMIAAGFRRFRQLPR